MAREDWRDERRWYEDREDREFQRAPDYGPAGYGYNGRDDRTHPGYRAAREDVWLDDRRRAVVRCALELPVLAILVPAALVAPVLSRHGCSPHLRP